MIIIIAVTVIATLIANELSDFSPWMATRLVRWSASQAFPEDPERAKARAEDLEAYVDAIPGKLSKLGSGLGFGAAGIREWTVRSFKGRPSWLRALPALPALPAVVVVPLAALLFVLSSVLGFFVFALVMGIFFILDKTDPPLGIGLTAAVWAPIVGVWVVKNILGTRKEDQAEAAASSDASTGASHTNNLGLGQ
jgi:hypothetical protein